MINFQWDNPTGNGLHDEEEDFPTAELDDPVWYEDPIPNKQQLCIHHILCHIPRPVTQSPQPIQEDVLPEPEQIDIKILDDLPDIMSVPEELSSDSDSWAHNTNGEMTFKFGQ